ncbi:MAG: DUF2029 domain-containing protein, partial [Oscillochloris sp.]|nr:DUF2029 domain-containing protein [Oscillochloris sp.]
MPDHSRPRSPVLQIGGVFLVLTIFVLGIAHIALSPYEYYGTLTFPRFADPWVERAETLIKGGVLYRDVSTMTPPLINFLLVPPTIVSGWFGHRNPAISLSFVLYFALFNLITAYLLFFQERDRVTGRMVAFMFLLNPLTLGNAILRRQDEAILVFGFAVILLLLTRQKNTWASVAIGVTILVKLTAALMIPIVFLRTKRWRHLFIPAVIFGLVMIPFLLGAGESAIFWDFSRREAEHPFQFDGLNPVALWYAGAGSLPSQLFLFLWSSLFVVGIGLALARIIFRPRGIWEDTSILLCVTMMVTPKLHCGYLSLLVLTLAPLVPRYRIGGLLWLFGLLSLVADFVKWPAELFRVASAMMVVAFVLLGIMLWRISHDPGAQPDPAAMPDQHMARLGWLRWAGAACLVLGLPVLTLILATPHIQRYDVGVLSDYISAATLFDREHHDLLTLRWTRVDATLNLHGAYSGPAILRLRLFHQGHDSTADGQLHLLAKGRTLASFAVRPGWRVYHLALPDQALASSGVGAAPLSLVSDQYLAISGDSRERGVAVDWAEVAPELSPPSPLGRALYNALLLSSGLVLALEGMWYLVTVIVGWQPRVWGMLLSILGAFAAVVLPIWAYYSPPSLA